MIDMPVIRRIVSMNTFEGCRLPGDVKIQYTTVTCRLPDLRALSKTESPDVVCQYRAIRW